MKLSLCIATFNEEKFIHYPLTSAYDLADEVIIVDGGSTDRTASIAKSYGEKVKVITADNPAMFHINKQKALQQAQGEWILQLDADEALTEELKEEIKTLLATDSLHQRPPANYVAYWIPRKNFFLSRFLTKGGQYPDYTIRLYKNGAAKFPCESVHENVEVKGEIGYLKNPIHHFADLNFSRYLARWHRYNRLEAQSSEFKIRREKKNPLILFFEYIFWKPISTFFLMYFRHKGALDGWPGLVFAFYSSIRYWEIYWISIYG